MGSDVAGRRPPERPVVVLVVEDDDAFAELLCVSLSLDQGIQLHRRVRSVREAEAALRAGGVDLVLTDYRLPDGTAVEVAGRALALAPGSPVVVMTAHYDRKLACDAFRSGASAVLDKLAGPLVILETIRNVALDVVSA